MAAVSSKIPRTGAEWAQHRVDTQRKPIIQAGEKIPEFEALSRLVYQVGSTPTVYNFKFLEECSGERPLVIFSVPGANTPVCTKESLPKIKKTAEAIRKLGADVAILSVNNRDTMYAWDNEITMIPDYAGDITFGLGLGMFDPSRHLGFVAQRGAAVAFKGKLLDIKVEPSSKVCTKEYSDPESVLERLPGLLAQIGLGDAPQGSKRMRLDGDSASASAPSSSFEAEHKDSGKDTRASDKHVATGDAALLTASSGGRHWD